MILSALVEVIKFVFISLICSVTAASAIIVIGTPFLIYGTWLRGLVQPIRVTFSQLHKEGLE